jgi:uncharacterized protein YjbI with pentapeptide repeats
MRRAAVATAVLALSIGAGTIAAATPAQAATCALGPGASCAGADLRGRDLSGLDLSRSDLRGADLSGANLHGSQLDFSDLSGADLDGIDARSVDFAMTRMSDVSASGGNFHWANFYGANVHRTDFTDADVRGASFHGADFAGTRFAGAQITGTVVTPSNIGQHANARNVFFDRVHTHIKAYGAGDRHCNNDSAGHGEETWCVGSNDDGNATAGLTRWATFRWAPVAGGSRPFWIKGGVGDPDNIELHGTADPGLASFDVRSASGTAASSGGHTPSHAHRGQVGGPLAMNVSYHDGFGHPSGGGGSLRGGYSLTLIGWLQHGGTAVR